MFDSRDTRMPSRPDNALGDFIIDILRKENDPLGSLAFVDHIVSEGNYTNRDFDELVEAVFDAADVLTMAGRRVKDVGEAVYSALILYTAWLANKEKARFIDDLSTRAYDDFMAMVDNYERLLDAIEEERNPPRGRDDRYDRGRGRDSRDRDDRGRGGRESRSFSRRDNQRSRSRHPDDIRADRQREAREREEEERRSRRDTPRSAPREERKREEPRRSNSSDPVEVVRKLSTAKRKQELSRIELTIWRYLTERKDDENRRLRREELESLNIDPEYYLALGGTVTETGQTHAEASQPRAATSPAPANAEPRGEASTRELNRGSRRAEAQREARERSEGAGIQPPAFEEVFSEGDQQPLRASAPRSERRDERPAVKETVSEQPVTDSPRVLTPPTIDPSIDYNANITSIGVKYQSGDERPEWDPLVPTLQQWAEAGYDVNDPAFIATLPPLPPLRGYLDHLPTMYDANLWVPQLEATVDGYRMTTFRERDMNKDDIMVPEFGGGKRRDNEPGKAPFYEAVSKTTRFDPLAVKAEESASLQRYDEDMRQWEEAGKPADQEPAHVPVDTQRHGQLAVVGHTVHAYNMDDAIVRIQTHMAELSVGRDNMANISAHVQLHQLAGVCITDEQFLETKTALAVFEPGELGRFLMLPQLWREFTEARTAVPSVIWMKIDRHLTGIMNDILQNQLGTHVTISSFAEFGNRLIDTVADMAGRYLAEKFTEHAEYISRRLRCLSFDTQDNLANIPNSVWILDDRRVVFADATMAELGITSTASQPGEEPVADTVELGQTKRYAIRPEYHRLIAVATDRLMGESRNTVSASSASLSDMVVDVVTLDNYRCVLSQNWLSRGLYLSMQVSQF